MWNNYFALLVRTDNQTQSGHDYVVVYADLDLIKVNKFSVDYIEKTAESKPQIMIVKLVDDLKAIPGALISDDEYN